ncbi:MAG: hypothetical protein V4792_04345 [Pseudomonadota bacterium]
MTNQQATHMADSGTWRSDPARLTTPLRAHLRTPAEGVEVRHAETYRGCYLEVSAYEVRRGAWTWVYLIDAKVAGRSRTDATLPEAQMALQRAVLAARLRADAMPSVASPF